jgi:hypothetical protein
MFTMNERDDADKALLRLARAIAAGDTEAASRLLEQSPALARASFATGASRAEPKAFFLKPIGYYVYAGSTALHVAAAAHQTRIAQQLIDLGADVSAPNRRGAEPLHAAAIGRPGSPNFDPEAQAATIACLIATGGDPNAIDMSGVTPLHRAVRTRSAAAVQALLDHGADVGRKTKNGSTALRLATLTTGRSGSGSPEAKAQQQRILHVLAERGAR